MKRWMAVRIARIEKRAIAGYDFIANTLHYLRSGYGFKKAIDTASNTIKWSQR